MNNKKMTLRLQWYDLKEVEAKDISAQIESMAKDIFSKEGKRFRLSWKSKTNLRIRKRWVAKTGTGEMQFFVRKQYNQNGLYSFYCRVSVTPDSMQNPLQNVLEQMQTHLQYFFKNTNLFAGYLLYEPHPLGVHGYYHLFPGKIPAHFEEERYLVGYEWAAYISKYLVQQLKAEEIAELEQYALVTRENDGLFYQSKCPITDFGLEEKKVYKKIFQTILKPGFQCLPVSAPYLEDMKPVMEQAYLMRRTEDKEGKEYIGFFYKMKPEDTPISAAFDYIKKIPAKDEF